MEQNVRLIYLYRDAGNYKSWAEVIFANPDKLTLLEIEQRLRHVLFQTTFFVASQVQLREVFLYSPGDAKFDDICFHEFDSVESSSEEPTDTRTIKEFAEIVELEAEKGWRAFDPQLKGRHPQIRNSGGKNVLVT